VAEPAVSVCIPSFNGERHIEECLDSIAAQTFEDFEVLVVDDASTDGTAAIADRLAREDPRVRVVHNAVNLKLGGALRAGYAAATKDLVFYTDGDAQYDPTELALLVDSAGDDVDVVQGYKRRRGDNIARRVIGRVYHRFVRTMFGLKIRDTDCDFRLIRRALLDRVELVHSTGVICVEMVRKFQDAGARFVEVPVSHFPRTHGTSQFFRPGSVVRSLRDLAVLWVRLIVLRQGKQAAAPGPRGGLS